MIDWLQPVTACADFVLQANRSRRDAEDALTQLEHCRKELQSARRDTDTEISQAFISQYHFSFVRLMLIHLPVRIFTQLWYFGT